jgi:hypothetical protein
MNKVLAAQRRRRTTGKLPYWMAGLVWFAAILIFALCSVVTLLIGSRFTSDMHAPWGISVTVTVVFEFCLWQPLVLGLCGFLQVFVKLKEMRVMALVPGSNDHALPI